jgi:predicted Fe-Mo cluster-binding NifX family protein
MTEVLVCVPVTVDGLIDPRWGRASRVAIAEVTGHQIAQWHEYEVGWDTLHDAGSEGTHHARVARFLQDQNVEAVVANHMGPPMAHMLDQMGLRVYFGAHGDARKAVLAAVGVEPN